MVGSKVFVPFFFFQFSQLFTEGIGIRHTHTDDFLKDSTIGFSYESHVAKQHMCIGIFLYKTVCHEKGPWLFHL